MEIASLSLITNNNIANDSSNKIEETDNINPLMGSGTIAASGSQGLPPDDDDEDKDKSKVDNQTLNDPNKIKNTYPSVKESSNYPQGFRGVQNGTTKHNINNRQVLENLRKVEQGQWQKIYQNEYDSSGNRVSIHYFQSQSDRVFDVKVKLGWSLK